MSQQIRLRNRKQTRRIQNLQRISVAQGEAPLNSIAEANIFTLSKGAGSINSDSSQVFRYISLSRGQLDFDSIKPYSKLGVLRHLQKTKGNATVARILRSRVKRRGSEIIVLRRNDEADKSNGYPLSSEFATRSAALEKEALKAAQQVLSGGAAEREISPAPSGIQRGIWSRVKGTIGRGVEWISDNIVGPIRSMVASGWESIQGLGSHIEKAYRQANPMARDWFSPQHLLFRTITNLRRNLYAEAIERQRRAQARQPGMGPAGPTTGAEESGLLLERIDEVAREFEDVGGRYFEINKEITEGAFLGDFKENPSIWNTIGQIAIGFVPYAGQAADIRDLIACGRKLKGGGWRSGWQWFDCALTVIGFIPGLGDIVKAIGRGAKGLIRRALRGVLRHGGRIWRGGVRLAKSLWRGARQYGARLLRGAVQTGRRLLQRGRRFGQRLVSAGRRIGQRVRGLIGRVSQGVRRLATSALNRARNIFTRARGLFGRIVGGITRTARQAVDSAKNLVSRGQSMIRRAIAGGRRILGQIRDRAVSLGRQAVDFLKNSKRRAIDLGRRLYQSARNRVRQAIKTATQRGRQIASRIYNRASSMVRAGMRWVRGRAIPWIQIKLRPLKERLLGFLRDRWNRLREKVYRGLEKVGLRKVAIGHSKPWNMMTHTERRAFQHSYSRHAHEFGLPNWSNRNAESLRQQFNTAAQNVRSNAQRVFMTYKPVGGVSQPVRYFDYVDSGGVRYYYYETLTGQFVSAGRARP